MWQIEYIREIMKEHVKDRTFYMYLPRLRDITNETHMELARMDNSYETQKDRYWYCPRVDINRHNCDDVMDLFILTFDADIPWAKTQMRSLNKQFKHAFFKHLYLTRRDKFRNSYKKGEIKDVLVPKIP